MSRTVALSGRRQAGKGTLFKFIRSLNDRAGVPTREFFFAYHLKRMCVDVLGLREEQAFGTDAEKNTEVPHLLWDNFPVQESRRVFNERGYVVSLRSGPMTGREVLQFWGTEVFRKAYPGVWVNACLRSISKWHRDNPGGVAVVTDLRFADEFNGVEGAGGKVIRLTRAAFPDTHESERALDPGVFDHRKFHLVLDNAGLGAAGTCLAAYPWLLREAFVPASDAFSVRTAATAAS